MLKMTMQEISQALPGRLVQGPADQVISQVCIDSRKVEAGDLFFALRGERVDGHRFAAQAALDGAGGLVLSELPADLPAATPVLLVPDTLQALQQLAAYNRSKVAVPVVGITGSTGKTTTKDMVAAVLAQSYRTLKTAGNFNNELGLPLTLLGLNQEHQAAVVEMGMRGLGEITALCRIAQPTGAVITNIGETHLELLGSVANIARAKGELLEAIPAHGYALLNAESPLMREQAKRCPGRVWFYAIDGPADITARDIVWDGAKLSYRALYPGGSGTIVLPVPGRHNVLNSLAALGVGLMLGLSFEAIAAGLAGVTMTGMRLEIKRNQGITVINDAYNANPTSTKAALAVLSEMAADGRKIAVLGNMFELGERACAGHREVGAAAAGLPVAGLVTVGDLAGWIAEGAEAAGLSRDSIFRCSDNQQAVHVLKELLTAGDTVLVKGSRGMQMEEIVRALT